MRPDRITDVFPGATPKAHPAREVIMHQNAKIIDNTTFV